MKIVNMTTGEVCELEFKAEGWGGKHKHDTSGYVYPNEVAAKKKQRENSFFIHGKYT